MGSGPSPCNLLNRALSWRSRPFIACWPLRAHTCRRWAAPRCAGHSIAGRPEEAPPRGPGAGLPGRGRRPPGRGRGRGRGSARGGGGVGSGLPVPQASPREGQPRGGPTPPPACRRPTEHRALLGQRARRRPSRVTGGCELRSLGIRSRRGSPNAGGARSSAGDLRSAPLPRPPHPPGPARALPGFSPASAAAAVSARTLGSLCERPRDPRQLLASSDAAMARAQGKLEGAAWSQSIRGGQGHCRGGRRGRLCKKQKEKGPGEGRSRRTAPGPRDNSLAAAAKRIPARGLALLFIRVYSHSSVCIPGKKKS